MVTEILIDKVISNGEQLSDTMYRNSKTYLPFFARLLLLSHFVQDNVIAAHYWPAVIDKMNGYWDTTVVVAFAVCFVARILGFVLALFRKQVPLACGLLLGSGIFQMCTMLQFPNTSNLLVNASVFGSLFFLLAENMGENSSPEAGVPRLDNRKTQDYFKLAGRCLLMLMFINFITLEVKFHLIIQDIIGLALMILVILGHRTKFSVLVTILYLNIFNFDDNDWWNIRDNPHERMLVQHKFLEGISVTGGLLMLVLHGPGEISLDKMNKTG